MIGIVMLLISGLSTTNGIRDLLQKDFISGTINIMNSMLGASGIAFGTAIPMILFGGVEAEGFILTPNLIVQLISCTAACVGFALWFKIRGMQVVYCGIGAFFTWLIYALVYEARPSNFLATTIAATFVAFYAFIMSRINNFPDSVCIPSDSWTESVLCNVRMRKREYAYAPGKNDHTFCNLRCNCIWI